MQACARVLLGGVCVVWAVWWCVGGGWCVLVGWPYLFFSRRGGGGGGAIPLFAIPFAIPLFSSGGGVRSLYRYVYRSLYRSLSASLTPLLSISMTIKNGI